MIAYILLPLFLFCPFVFIFNLVHAIAWYQKAQEDISFEKKYFFAATFASFSLLCIIVVPFLMNYYRL